jgi:hypothetical protein
MLVRPFPQRLPLGARPGSLLKGAAPIAPSCQPIGDADYLALVRQCPCIRCGLDAAGEAAHIRSASGAHGKASGIGKKPAACWIIPLCGGCHREDRDALHKVGEPMFFYRVGVNPFLLAERLWAKRGDLVAMRAVIFVAISEREAISQ